MPAYDSRTKLEALRDHFEIFAKGANYLLIGHGAGFVGCLSFLMQHAEKEQAQFQLLGSLVLLFGSGLLLASIFWFAAMVVKLNVTQAIISDQRPTRAWWPWLRRKFLEIVAYIGLWGSFVIFVVAIVLIMAQFTDSILPFLTEWRRSHPT
jgi:Zn-dependent protease with chaperone function